MTDDIKTLAKNLPKPHTPEEQYLYTLACETAGVTPSKLEGDPYKSPFWRMEQYWYVFCKGTAERLGLPVIPDDNTVKLSALTEEVLACLLGENRVTTIHLQDKSVTMDKLADAVADKLLASGRVTEDMLATAVANKLLGNKRVTLAMLEQSVQDTLAKVK